MKKVLSLLLAVVMLMGLSVGVMADTVTVKDVADTTAKKYTVDGNSSTEPLMIATLLAYEKTYPESEYKLSDEQKESLVETYSEKIQTQTGAAQISQSALVLLGLGCDPANISTADGGTFNALQKISDLITDDTKNSWMKGGWGYFNYPYCFYILQQYGDEYQEAIDKLLEVAKTNSESWLNTKFGPDGLGFVMPALAPYYNTDPEIKKLLDEGAESIKAMVNADGKIAYTGYPNGNEYSTGLCVNALAGIGIDPNTVKAEGSEKSLVDGLLSFAKDNVLSSEQCYRGIIAAANAKAGDPYYIWDINGVFDPVNVTFRMIGDSKHDKGVDGHKEYVTWIKTVSYEMPAGSSAMDLFDKAVAEYKLEYKVKEGTTDYIYTVKAPAVLGGYWLEEKDNGDLSGWMYKLNGKDSTNTISQQKLADGDAIVFHYTDDLMKENFDTDTTYLNRWLEAEDITPEEYVANQNQDAADAVETLISAIGTVTKDSKTAIDAARAAYDALTEAQKALVENYDVLTAAEAAYEKLVKVEVIDPAELPFTDVKTGDWFAEEVAYVYSYELMNGMSDTAFEPETTLNRAMMATILYRIEGEPKVTVANPFADVVAGEWYTDAILWAAEQGVVNGYEDGTFKPTRNISREEMAAMMYRYAEFKNADMSVADDLSDFSDGSAVSGWALENMKWAVAADLINGMGNHTLAPQGTATRAQAATVLMRFNENIL